MALDHYVSQVHLKQFFSPALGSRMYATKKSDLKSFPCHSRDVCRIENGSTNAYLANDRAVEDFLRGVEPNYDKSLGKLRASAVDRECVATFAGFAAFVSSCAPAAMRIHTRPFEKAVEAVAITLDRQGRIEKAPPSLGSKSITELMEGGAVRIAVDPKYPQAVGISTIVKRTLLWGNSKWEILRADPNDCPFFSSDYPVALKAKGNNLADWVVPLAPDIAILIMPNVTLSGTTPDSSFKSFTHQYRHPSRSEIVDINRLIVRCAEEMVFFRDNLPWVANFIEKNRNYRIEIIDEKQHMTQRIVSYDHAGALRRA